LALIRRLSRDVRAWSCSGRCSYPFGSSQLFVVLGCWADSFMKSLAGPAELRAGKAR
jgi:hypothetical protein